MRRDASLLLCLSALLQRPSAISTEMQGTHVNLSFSSFSGFTLANQNRASYYVLRCPGLNIYSLRPRLNTEDEKIHAVVYEL